jgi:hypothetical protein
LRRSLGNSEDKEALRQRLMRELEEATGRMVGAIGYDQYYYWFKKARELKEELRRLEANPI